MDAGYTYLSEDTLTLNPRVLLRLRANLSMWNLYITSVQRSLLSLRTWKYVLIDLFAACESLFQCPEEVALLNTEDVRETEDSCDLRGQGKSEIYMTRSTLRLTLKRMYPNVRPKSLQWWLYLILKVVSRKASVVRY